MKNLKTDPKTNPKAPMTKAPRKSKAQDRYVLRLFVAGATDRSRQAVLRVRQLCADDLHGNCDLEVIDIYQQPELARENQIVATPTLIKERPRPIRRFIGNMIHTSGLLAELDLIPGTPPPTKAAA